MTNLTDEKSIQFARAHLAAYISLAGRTDMSKQSAGYMIPRPHHMQMINRLQKIAPVILQQGNWVDWGNERHTAIVSPPGSAKTTILRHFYEWILGNASLSMPNWADSFHMGHVSHSADQALEMSLAVRNTIDGTDEFSGPVFKACFPDVKKSEKWAEKGWRVEGCVGIHETFTAFGVDGSISGVRWNVMGLDDLIKPVKPNESTITPADVEAIIYTVENVCMERLVEGGCGVLTNTRWFERDPTSWALGQGWNHILIQALNEEDESFWEERQIFKAETLIAKREANPLGFALQYMGQPAPESGIDFKAEWLDNTYDALPWQDAVEFGEDWYMVVSWDTAGTINPRSDETAGWTAAVHPQSGKIYLMELYHGKWEFQDLLNVLRANNEFWKPCVIWVEDKSTGTAAIQTLLLEGLPMKDVPAYGQKGKRSQTLDTIVNNIKPWFAENKVYFPSPRFAQSRNMDWLGEARKQLLMYPRALHDDIPRALIQLIYETMLGLQKGMFYKHMPVKRTWGEASDQRAVV